MMIIILNGVFKQKRMEHYCIVKMVKSVNGKELPVIMLDSHDEVWEFEVFEEAERIANILEKNSDSGHRYWVKKV